MHDDLRDASLWKVLRDDGTVLGRYSNKPAAVAAMIRFSAGGGGYQVINETPADRLRWVPWPFSLQQDCSSSCPSAGGHRSRR